MCAYLHICARAIYVYTKYIKLISCSNILTTNSIIKDLINTELGGKVTPAFHEKKGVGACDLEKAPVILGGGERKRERDRREEEKREEEKEEKTSHGIDNA